MANYMIRARNGITYHIEGPDGASDEDVRAEVMRQYPDADKAPISTAAAASPATAQIPTTARPTSMIQPDFGEVSGIGSPQNGQRLSSDPDTQSHVDAMMRAGASFADVNRYAISRGMAPVNRGEYEGAMKYLRANPGYQGSMVNAQKYVPLTTYEKAATAVGDNPVGTSVINAAQVLSGNTLDNLVGLTGGDAERAQQGTDYISAHNPVAATTGQIGGGILAAGAGEAGLARLGMTPGLARATLADIVMGSANGAGAADGGDRVIGALQGGATAAAGSLGGRAVTTGTMRMIAPEAGRLSGLYAAGVRPTIGQRFANAGDGRGLAGMAGKTVNAAEEALQSVPIVGAAIRGARQEARDQFQIGAFNQALGEIGEELPKGMRPGTDPHQYAQQAFNRVYDRARSGMTMVADAELANDLGNLAPDIATLGPQTANKLRAIMANSVNNKLRGGQMTGDAYKRAMSDLGKHIARLGKSPMAEDQHLGEILTNIQRAIDGAARRSSNPEAVALLDAADAGYAKLVRIEDAAKRRGGDAGTFSPANFDSAVQNTSGGVRSKSYLRGDALMQDYAAAGRTLEDRLPNSGTADRVAMGTVAAGGAAYMNPATLGILGAIGAIYAPGVRKLMQNSMAPRGRAAQAIAAQLQKRARLVAATGAASAVAALPGTSPGQ